MLIPDSSTLLEVLVPEGTLVGAPFHESPNQDARPDGARPELVILHGISLPPGEYGGPWIRELFLNRLPPDQHPYFREVHALRVSSHLLIRRNGATEQFVPFHRRAWHAGESCFEGREACNDFAIGIELEGADDQPYADAQYEALLAVLRALLAAYPTLSAQRIVGHEHVAPGRKTDPGPAFDWARLRAALGVG